MIKQLLHIILVSALLFSCNKTNTKKIDLKESFSYTDARPFGTSVAYDMLQDAYSNTKINIVKKDFAENYNWTNDTNSVYFNISKSYYVEERDIDAMLEFVYKGNTMVISANNFDTNFFNRLICTQYKEPEIYSKTLLRQTSTTYTNALSLFTDTFHYFYAPFANHFPELNSSYARVIGYNQNGDCNMFVFFWGTGRLILHAEPRAFSNYFLLENNNYLYMQQLLQMLPVSARSVYWDNFYNRKNAIKKSGNNGNSLNAIFKHPSLSSAFLIALSLLLFYIFFNAKRRQRVIPVVKPNDNTSIAFAEAIAGLYLNKKDNKVIAEKMISFLNDHVRSKYFFNTSLNDQQYTENLSRKSGVDFDHVYKLTMAMRQSMVSPKITDESLLELNSLIETFLKH